LSDPESAEYREMTDLAGELSGIPSWGNARDLNTLANKIVIDFVPRESSGPGLAATLTLSGEDMVTCTKSMLDDRRERYAKTREGRGVTRLQQVALQ
jgi:hypothetical protein